MCRGGGGSFVRTHISAILSQVPCVSSGREALLEEDVPEEEAAEELAPLSAQLAYTHAEMRRADEAAAAYQVLDHWEALRRLHMLRIVPTTCSFTTHSPIADPSLQVSFDKDLCKL